MKKPVAFFTVLLFLATIFLPAQQKNNFMWATAGAGFTSAQNARWELSAGFSANYAREKNLLGIRALFNEEFVIMKTPLSIREYAIYAGKYFRSSATSSYAALAGGFSFETWNSYGERYYPQNGFGTYYTLDTHYSPGLALDLQAGSNFGRYFSIGAHVFAAINTKKTIAGILLSVRVGIVDEKQE